MPRIPFPTVIDGIRVRILTDGTFLLVRASRETQTKMDTQFIRYHPRETRWYLPLEQKYAWDDLVTWFVGKPLYIIGKGPSIDNLTVNNFKRIKTPNDFDSQNDFDNISYDSPIICLNESIHAIEKLNLINPVYCLQQDHQLKDTCHPLSAMLIVAYLAAKAYGDYEDKLVYFPEELNCSYTTLSVEIAIEIGKRLGSSEFIFLGFDAIVNGDLSYAKSIGHQPNGDPLRYISTREKMLSRLVGYPYSIV